jgi:hypothetical protein
VAFPTRAKGTTMSLLDQKSAHSHRGLRVRGDDVARGTEENAPPPASTPEPPARVMLTPDDLLWFKTSQDEEGRLTLGLLACSPTSIGVLVDDNGDALGLRLSRSEAQDLNRTLMTWLAGTERMVTS